MKGASLWEPWASLMFIGAKKIETRSWPTRYRGPLVICAAMGGMPHYKLQILINTPEIHRGLKPLNRRWPGLARIKDLNFGKALCIVDLIDCVPTESLNPMVIGSELPFGDYTPGRFAWLTTNLRRFEEPFKLKGGQRIFNIPDEIIEGHAIMTGQV